MTSVPVCLGVCLFVRGRGRLDVGRGLRREREREREAEKTEKPPDPPPAAPAAHRQKDTGTTHTHRLAPTHTDGQSAAQTDGHPGGWAGGAVVGSALISGTELQDERSAAGPPEHREYAHTQRARTRDTRSPRVFSVMLITCQSLSSVCVHACVCVRAREQEHWQA